MYVASPFSKSALNDAQSMWIDTLHASLMQQSFNPKLGGLAYVMRNIVAKYVSSTFHYHVTEGAASLIDGNEGLRLEIEQDLPIDMKKYFYGKKYPTVLEHMIPASVIANKLLEIRKLNLSRSDVEQVMRYSGSIAIMLRDEDAKLNSHPYKLKSKMPPCWTYGQPVLARYDAAGIKLSDYLVRRGNNIYR